MRVELTATSETAKQMYKSSVASGLDSKGGDVIYFFRFWKAFSHSSSHLSCCALLMALKKGLHLSMDRGRKQLRAAARPVKLWISFKVVGDFIYRIARICLRYASIPRWVTRYPKNLPEDTPNVHLEGLSFILYFLRMLKVSTRLPMWYDRCLPFTMMSTT
ncbi:hypothetical protein ACFX16_000425 [Malus domestica]